MDLTEAELEGATMSCGQKYEDWLKHAEGFGKVWAHHSAIQDYLEGATMPNGQKYEDWLKSKDREEDGKNE